MQQIPKNYIVAIDGVSGSGKSSTAQAVADRLHIFHLDTGAMYRAITYLAMQAGLPVDAADTIADLTSKVAISVSPEGKLLFDGRSLAAEIRKPDVSAKVSDYCKIPKVREILVQKQREIGARQSTVMEGRDIGSVVFPQAQFKFFMWASPEVRAKRRLLELQAKHIDASFEEVLHNLQERDEKDSSRDHSPLFKAPDAVEIDTSGLTFAEQVAMITELVLKKQPSL